MSRAGRSPRRGTPGATGGSGRFIVGLAADRCRLVILIAAATMKKTANASHVVAGKSMIIDGMARRRVLPIREREKRDERVSGRAKR